MVIIVINSYLNSPWEKTILIYHGFQLYYLFITIYGTLKQKPKDEVQKSQRPHIIAEHQWYKKNILVLERKVGKIDFNLITVV